MSGNRPSLVGTSRLVSLILLVGALMLLLPSVASAAPIRLEDAAVTGGNEFGTSMDISADTLVVGAPSGSYATVFVRDTFGNWTEQQRLVGSDVVPGEYFGYSVAINGDTIAVGAMDHNRVSLPGGGYDYPGGVYVFTRTAGVWTEQAHLDPGSTSATFKFGSAVALTSTTLAVGAFYENGGAVYVYTGSGSTWSLQQKLTASDAHTGDGLGFSVAISGDVIVSSARSDSAGANWNGSAYVFRRAGSVWTQEAKLLEPGTPNPVDSFGWAVAVDGNRAVITAKDADHVAANDDNAGKAWVWVYDGVSAWSVEDELVPAGHLDYDMFGISADIEGDVVMIGAFQGQCAFPSMGKAYEFSRSGATWPQTRAFTSPVPAVGSWFGRSVAVAGTSRYVGAAREGAGGVAYVFGPGATTNPPNTGMAVSSGNPNTPAPPPITVTLTGADPDSDYLRTWYRVNGSPVAFTLYTGPFQLTTPGGNSVEYYSEDVAGNTEPTHFSLVQVSTNSAPVTTLYASGGIGSTSSGPVSVTLGVTDQENDPFTTYVSINGQTPDGHERLHA